MTKTLTPQEIFELASDVSLWTRADRLHESFPQFSKNQITRLVANRGMHPGFARCYRKVGNVGYVHERLFAAYLAGLMPEQEVEHGATLEVA
jgi:hypothetical protein